MLNVVLGGCLGACWGRLGTFWGLLGAVLGRLGTSWAHLSSLACVAILDGFGWVGWILNVF